jgi:CHAT domain-containing protein
MIERKSQHCLPSRYWRLLVSVLVFLPLIWSFSVLMLGCSVHQPPMVKSTAESKSSPEVSLTEHMEEGLRSFQRGDFDQAVSSWTEASQLFKSKGMVKEQCKALIKISRAYQAIGRYNKAIQTLEVARILAEKSEDKTLIATVLGSLGNAYIATGPEDESYRYLNEGLTMARNQGDSRLSADILNNLGNLLTLQGRYSEAIGVYLESKTLADKTANYALATTALANAAMASNREGRYKEAEILLGEAWEKIQGLDDSQERAYGLINIGLAYRDLRQNLYDPNNFLQHLALRAFYEAISVSEAIENPRTTSYALGYLGKLYQDEKRYQEALELTRGAIFAAQQVNAHESLYRWQWQAGRLLTRLDKLDEAISAYRHAVLSIQSIRQEFSSCYGRAQASFRESAGSVYFELVDLLLQRAATVGEGKQHQAYLLEAREAVEVLKAYELRDYFEDDCVDAARTGIKRLDIVSETAIVVYPIVLQDRTEILVSLPSGMKRFAVHVKAESLTREIREFRYKLEKRTTREYLPHAQQLYDWLIRPLEPDLANLTIDTLVFVPDGPLRTIPMAALHDGKEFLINKYALAITPGLNLTDPSSIDREDMRVLAVGLTESAQGFSPLPFVSDELRAIQTLYGAKVLLNQDFLISNIKDALDHEYFNIVHIASHGQFEDQVDKTFLLSFDGRITMDLLDKYVGLFKFRRGPLELLTLSACETAAGDDRAALGLAGVAIKTGARSALATLWFINDQASSILLAEFYRQLRDPSTSRAVALQRAQLRMLNDLRYEHPAYWSPFLLINNWL